VTLDELLGLFRLPAAAVLERRVAKSDFADHLASGGKPADRRLVNDRIDALHWHAALNPANTGLPASSTPGSTPGSAPGSGSGGISGGGGTSGGGLAVVTLVTRTPGGKRPNPQPPPRLIELVHRTVPDPLILLTAHTDADGPARPGQATATTLSVKPGLGEVLVADVLAPETAGPPPELGPLLAVDRASSLDDLHTRWTEAVLGLAAFNAVGRFPQPAGDGGDPAARREALDRVVALDAEIRRLTTAARRERQAGRRAELNSRLQHARRQRREAAEAL